MESRDKKGDDGDIWVYMCGGEKTREKRKKKKKKEMKTNGWEWMERKEK